MFIWKSKKCLRSFLLVFLFFVFVPKQFFTAAEEADVVETLLIESSLAKAQTNEIKNNLKVPPETLKMKTTRPTSAPTGPTSAPTKGPNGTRKHVLRRKIIRVITTVQEDETDCKSKGGSECDRDEQCCLGRCNRLGRCPTARELLDEEDYLINKEQRELEEKENAEKIKQPEKIEQPEKKKGGGQNQKQRSKIDPH